MLTADRGRRSQIVSAVNMEISGIQPFVSNAARHSLVIAAWQLAQISPHTLATYRRNLADYCAWLDQHNLDLLLVRRVHLDGYRHALTGAPSSVATTLSALSSFYYYAMDEGVTGSNPVQLVRRPKIDAGLSSTQGLSEGQAKDLLLVAQADSLRSHALVSLLMFTGMRISEALTTTTASYGHDSGHRTLSIRRKGGKIGKVAVPAPAVDALNLYLGTTNTDLVLGQSQSRLLFVTRTGRPWDRSAAFITIQRLAREAGIEGQIGPNSLRHTFATIALNQGVALHDLQDSMGHADPRTTRRYDRSRNNLTKSAGYDVARALTQGHQDGASEQPQIG